MPAETLQRLRERIDALAQGEFPRRVALFGRKRAPKTPRLLELDALLDECGVFTLADARALAQLAQTDLAPVVKALRRRSASAARELRARVLHEERHAHRRRRIRPEVLAELDDLWARLRRVVKVAEVLGDPTREVAEPYVPLAMPRRPSVAQSERVAAAEFLLERARTTAFDARQKRRDLAAAHELLLRIGSTLERGRVQRLRAEVSRARRGADRQGDLDAVRSVEQALRQGAGGEVWALARQAYLDALGAGDARLAGAARGVLGELEKAIPKGLAHAREADRAATLVDDAGAGAMAAVLAGDDARPDRDRLAELALQLQAEQWSVLELAAGFGNFFEVEGDEEIVLSVGPPRRVPYPTGSMAIDLARSTDEAPNFVVTDPRTIVYDLASDRQLVRAWQEPGVVEKRRSTSVRVYVCDASGSMSGARARFRDAILVSELNDLSVRAAKGLRASPFYFCFFNDKPSQLELVDTPAKALRQIKTLLAQSPAGGQTDITLALIEAFGAIRAARGRDPNLARATAVLVTDGEDRVDLEAIEKARKPVGGLEITLSFISLGQENADLKALVLEQCAKGRRAFYYHLADEQIAAGRTAFDTGLRTLLPNRPTVALDPGSASLRAALDALRAATTRTPAEARALAETRFTSYFTPPAGGGALGSQQNAARVAGILDAVAETAAMAPAEKRRAEAVELLEHLLRAYQLTSADYFAALSVLGAVARERLSDLNLLCPAKTA